MSCGSKRSIIIKKRYIMQTVYIPSASHSRRHLESGISFDESSPSQFSDNVVSSSSQTPEMKGRIARPSPARAPPPIPRAGFSSPSPLSASPTASVNGSLVRDRSGLLQDTTVLSDLSDEILRVEARLAAIREEEARVAPVRNPPDASKRDNPRFASVENLNIIRSSSHVDSSPSQPFVRRPHETHNSSTEYPFNLVSKSSELRKNKAQTTSDGEEVSKEFNTFRTPPHGRWPPCQDTSLQISEVIHVNPVSDAFGGEHAVVDETDRRAGGAKGIAAFFEHAPPPMSAFPAERQWSQPKQVSTDVRKSIDRVSSSSLQPKKADGTAPMVFSLTSFLNPIQTVDIEVTPGVYEKLDIFAGDNVTDVARKFILKHHLDSDRALEPLCAFLSTFMASPPSTNAPVTTKCASEKNSTSDDVLRNINEKNKKSHVSSLKRCPLKTTTMEAPVNREDKPESKCVSLASRKPRAASCHSLPASARNIREQSTNVMSSTNSPIVTKMLVFNAEERRANSRCRSSGSPERKQIAKRREWHVSVSRATNAIGNSSSEAPCHADPHSMLSCIGKPIDIGSSSSRAPSASNKLQKRHTTPLSGSRDIGSQQSAPVRSVSAPRSRPRPKHAIAPDTNREVHAIEGRAIEILPRDHSSEARRAVPNHERARTSHGAEQDSQPTFKPSLAPRSIALAAKDAARRDGPAYARLHKRTPKLSRPSTAAAAATTPRSRGASVNTSRSADAAGEQSGRRLYAHAVDLQRRLRERRAAAERSRDEAERHSLRAGPRINDNARWLRPCDAAEDGGVKAAWPRCATLPRRQSDAKRSEERDLEACTFKPKVNPASVRMFNMVVRSQSVPRVRPNDNVAGDGFIERQTSSPLARSHSCGNSAGGGNGMRVEDRLLQLERMRRKKLDNERHFRETIDPATGQQLFRPFIGR